MIATTCEGDNVHRLSCGMTFIFAGLMSWFGLSLRLPIGMQVWFCFVLLLSSDFYVYVKQDLLP